MKTQSTPMPDAPIYDVDFTDPDVSADPYPHWERVRALGRVVWSPTTNGWLVTGFSDVRAVLRNSQAFETDANFSTGWGGRVISTTDGPYHHLLKEAFRPAFERDVLIAKWESAVDDVVRRCVSRAAAILRDGGTVELVDTFRDVPTETILSLLRIGDEVDPDIARKFQTWAYAMSETINAIYVPDPERRARILEEGAQARSTVHALAARLLEERQAPGVDEDDILRRLALCGLDGELNANHLLADANQPVMSVDDMRAQVAQLVGASQTNTHNNLSTCLLYLAKDPSLREEIAANRELIPAFIEEVLRHNSVFAVTPRIVGPEGFELAGVKLAPGDRVYAVNAAANRDPSRWENPDIFDIHRPMKAHVAFGFGTHTCLGSSLARMETRLLLNAVLDDFGQFELVENEVPYNQRFMARGPAIAHIRLAN